MTTLRFEESGMNFGPFEEGRWFRIEKSETYGNIKEGVRIAEFLLLDAEKLCIDIVEAKMSSPKPETTPNFPEFIHEIKDKLINTLNLTIASILKRHTAAMTEFPKSYMSLDLATVRFRFVLIIKNHKKEWLPPLQDGLRMALRATVSTWAMGQGSILVINAELAEKRGFFASQ